MNPISINNIQEQTALAFQDALYGQDQTLNLILSHLSLHSPSEKDMLQQELNFYWNKLFSKTVLEQNISLEIPSSIEKFPSVWFLEWNNYFNAKFSDLNTPLRSLTFDSLIEEKNKISTFLELALLPTQKLNEIANKILPNVPRDNQHPARYKDALKIVVLKIAIFDHLKHSYEDVSEDLGNIMQCFYSSFDYKDNETSYHDKKNNYVFETYFNKLSDQEIAQVFIEKQIFFDILSHDEAKFLIHISRNKEAFNDGFNKIAGMKEEKYTSQATELLYNTIITHNYYSLKDSLSSKETITHKRLKI